MYFVGHLLLFQAVKEFWKSVKNWQSYRHGFGVLLFWDSVYIGYWHKKKITLRILAISKIYLINYSYAWSRTTFRFDCGTHRPNCVNEWPRIRLLWNNTLSLTKNPFLFSSAIFHHWFKLSSCFCSSENNNQQHTLRLRSPGVATEQWFGAFKGCVMCVFLKSRPKSIRSILK